MKVIAAVSSQVQFYQQICDKLQIAPQQCLMVGNSLVDDLPATELGMAFYLMLNDDSEEACKAYTGQKGNRRDLLEWVQSWPIMLAQKLHRSFERTERLHKELDRR